MKQYEKKIESYQTLIQKGYVRESAVQNVMEQCAGIMSRQDDRRASYFEFLYEQFKFIRKRWWALQGGSLLLLWMLLADYGEGANAERVLGALSVISSYYSLRQICSARILMFAAVDLTMITIFFAVSFSTLQISAYRIVIDFLVPFNISCCICFRLLYSKLQELEYIAVFLSTACIFAWSMIVSTDFIYERISMTVWIGLLLLSFIYLIYCIWKSQCNCEINWEGKANGTAI